MMRYVYHGGRVTQSRASRLTATILEGQFGNRVPRSCRLGADQAGGNLADRPCRLRPSGGEQA